MLSYSRGGWVAFAAASIFFTFIKNRALGAFILVVFIAVYNAQLYGQVSYEKQRLDALLDSAADGILIQDAKEIQFGTGGDAQIGWDTSDANAECLMFCLGDPAGNVVPVALFGAYTTTSAVDHGFFNGISQPTIALLDADAASYLKVDWSALTAARITVGGAAASLTLGDATVPVTFGGMPRIPTATVAAAGDAQANAAAITTGFTLVSAADATKGVKLPAAVAGAVCIVKNNVAAVLKVWPATGDAINAESVNANDVLAASTSATYVAYDATTWYSIPLLGS